MDNCKKIFSEILEELNISELIKSSLIEKIDQVNIETYGEYTYSDRGCLVKCIVEERWKETVESEIKKLKRRKLISAFKKKFISGTVKFEIIEKENYELTLKNVKKFKKNNKDFLDENQLKDREERLLDQIDMEKLATNPDWQEKIEKNKKIKEGYIYILSNLALPRIYKIGFVKDDYVARAKSLKSETGLDRDFVIENIWFTKNPYEVEQKIFNSLQMQKNEEGEYHGKSYRSIKELNGKPFIEFVDGASLNFFCEKIEEFIQE